MNVKLLVLAMVLSQPAMALNRCPKCVDTDIIADGAITYEKLSPEVQAMLGYTEPKEFIDNGLTVTDTSTGLMWEKKNASDGVEDYSNPNDVDNRYTQVQTNVEQLNYSGFAGYSDWRLPTLEELKTILFAPDPCTGKLYGVCIADPLFYPNTEQYYWSATDWEINSDLAYVIFFASGYIAAGEKYGTFHVRAVRTQ